ncbi:hypothetical protein NM208_g1173 [Fusarium decemcellulare]|uniref:Uncharacterized protein n=1 Tax=Fusarium decemcellulare TaxID=57161 RepID=A0ACC1SX54_9HYPO|nr:hypothetical protein NM208_g1173 [Fusarium decemcellulare]
MLFTKAISLVISGAFAVAATYVPPTTKSSVIAIPTPTYLFTAKLQVGKPLDPIPLLEGGVVIVEPLVSGTISGPYLNGTIESGLVAALVVSNNTITGKEKSVQIPSIYVYGKTSDGLPIFVQETGVGPQAGQNTRLQIAVGGKYKKLQSSFIIGQPSMNKARTEVTVPCFDVPLAPGIHY